MPSTLCPQLTLERDPKLNIIELFSQIWGVGSERALALYIKGYRTLDDLRRRDNIGVVGVQPGGGGKDDLTRQQAIGLKYFDDLLKRIPRAEVEDIGRAVQVGSRELNVEAEAVVMGSYRRGKESSGDCDVLITLRDGGPFQGLLPELVRHLTQKGFLYDDLSLSTGDSEHQNEMYMGVCRTDPSKPFRRIDIKVYPRLLRSFAMLYFTGSDHFNRSMRHFAKLKGYSLSDHGLVPCTRDAKQRDAQGNYVDNKVLIGKTVVCDDEEAIFRFLRLDWKEPTERNC